MASPSETPTPSSSQPRKLALEIVTPDRPLVRDEVDEVELPGAQGYLGVLPGHTPLLTLLQVGHLWYRKGGETFWLAVSFGFAEVLPDRVTVLAQLAERAEDIDLPRAQAALQRADARLAKPEPELDYDRARLAQKKAATRVDVASHARVQA
jgi:F-type H+-transporting ATPase subunit epsilon